MSQAEAVAVAAFRHAFDAEPEWIARAPGRVNLIGEHTDYNDGFVLPMATAQETVFAVRARTDRLVDVVAADLGDRRSFSLDDGEHHAGLWSDYLVGVAWALEGRGARLQGWEGAVSSTVPVGSGLSSSAALEIGCAQVFAATGDLDWTPREMALAGQKAENEWLDLQTGIMDQYVSAAAQEGAALLIDCRSLETRLVALPVGCSVVVLDTMTRRGLVDSAYNERRAQCEQAAAVMEKAALRDCSLDDLEAAELALSETAFRRARHVITENARTLRAAQASDNAQLFGALMNESHQSMRVDFEISTTELDLMASLSQAAPGCFGARLTGAGFGGAVVALVEQQSATVFMETVTSQYQAETGIAPDIFVAKASPGASRRRFV